MFLEYNYGQMVLKESMKMTFADFEDIRKVYSGVHEDIKFFSDLDWSTYEKLYAFLNAAEEMPYGTQKARDGDPEEWIFDKLESEWDKELAIV